MVTYADYGLMSKTIYEYHVKLADIMVTRPADTVIRPAGRHCGPSSPRAQARGCCRSSGFKQAIACTQLEPKWLHNRQPINMSTKRKRREPMSPHTAGSEALDRQCRVLFCGDNQSKTKPGFDISSAGPIAFNRFQLGITKAIDIDKRLILQTHGFDCGA